MTTEDRVSLLHVAATANRLKAAYISLADDSEDKRGEHLRDIVENAIQDVLPEHRREFLKKVAEGFPCWDATARPPADAAPSEPTEPDLEDLPVTELADRLIYVSQLMEEDEKAQLLDRLREGGLTAAPLPSAPGADGGDRQEIKLPDRTRQAIQYLMKKVGIGKLDLTRTIKLLVLLIEYGSSSDQVIWSTWRTIAPRSSMRRPCDLRKEIGRYLSGDRAVVGAEINGHVERLRKLSASLIAGVGQAGSQFAKAHIARFAPHEIEASANQDAGMFVSREYKCWSKYVELANDVTEDSVEHDIKEAIARFTESLMQKTASQAEADKPSAKAAMAQTHSPRPGSIEEGA